MLEDVISQIGGKRPPRLYIREWMEELGVNNKKLAERMGRAESTVSKLLTAADPHPRAKTQQKVTVAYLAEFAEALNLEVPQLFRDPKAPTRDELLKGYTNEQLTSAIQLIEHSRKLMSPGAEDVAGSDSSDQPAGRRAARK